MADVARRPRSPAAVRLAIRGLCDLSYIAPKISFHGRALEQERGLDAHLDGSRGRRHGHARFRHIRAPPRGCLCAGPYREWPDRAGTLAMSRTGEQGIAAPDALHALFSGEALRSVFAALDLEGEETRVVGGALRDALSGRTVREIDLTTTLLPETVMARAEAAGLRAIPTGLQHGTVTVLAGRQAFEVTTLREDIGTDGRHADVRFGRDFRVDALRRDFTMNALSMEPGGQLFDYTGGLDDIAARKV